MENSIITELPRYLEGRYKNKVDWKKTVGTEIEILYGGIKYVLKVKDYTVKTYNLGVIYNNNYFNIKTNGFLKCSFGNILGLFSKEYHYNINDIIKKDNFKKIEITEKLKIKTKKYYKYKCEVDGYIGLIAEANLKQGNGCPICSNQKIIKGMNDITTTHPQLAKYFVNIEDANKHSRGSTKKVNIRCPVCNHIKKIQINSFINYGIACPKCGDGISYPNKLGFNLLQQLHRNFITEYSPSWINCKRYDFYFEKDNVKYIIEMDGGFHFVDNIMTGLSTRETEQIDNLKDKLAKEHSIYVIRINCQKSKLEYIKNNIINSKLNDIFDLNIVDWLQCEEFALKSLVKVASDLWNEQTSIQQICDILKLSGTTIRTYLKKAKLIGWCSYDSEEEQLRTNTINCSQLQENNKKEVICVTTGKIYTSLTEASSDIGRSISKLSSCCSGAQKSVGKLRDGTKLVWQYYSDFLINPKDKEYKNNVMKKVICLNTNEIFESASEGARIYNLDRSGVSACCRNKLKSHGKLEDGTKLVWMLYNEYLKLQ